MNIKVYELFLTGHSPKEVLEHLEQSIIASIGQVVREAVKESFAEYKGQRP
jgi:hypothetical protein